MSKIVPLNISTGHTISGVKLGAPFECEIQRTKRKTLGIYISHEKVVVRCPYVLVSVKLLSLSRTIENGSKIGSMRSLCEIKNYFE